MNWNSLHNKKIAILGLGLENLALVKYLLKHKVKSEITVCDARPEIKNSLPVNWKLGKDFNQGLGKFDILFRAPGWPVSCPGIQAALRVGVKLSSPMKLFFEFCPSRNIIGVTGTKGKGTTASLIYEILRASGKKVWLGGNIGVAPFEFIDKIRKIDWVVLELSSFQLEDMIISPRIAVITNFYREHLAAADPNNPNYHRSLKEYMQAKANIFRWQKNSDYLICNFQFSISKQFPISNFRTKGKKVYFKKSELPSKLIGEHNKENIGAAAAVAKILGIKLKEVSLAVAKFKGLPHRLEFARELKGIKYYDDSFATTPESTIIALKSFSSPLIILLGGADKGSDFKELAGEVKRRAKFVVLLKGNSTPKIKEELIKIGFKPDKITPADNIKLAVKLAWNQAVRGDIILLSTACASFGMFKNYKERGNLFKAEVKSLKIK